MTAYAAPFSTARSETMSAKHPIIAMTGSSGAGTSSVKATFEQIFRRERIEVAYVEGDSFHRYDREEMKAKMAEAQASGNYNFSHFGPEANLLSELENLFREYGETGSGRYRHYAHDENEAAVLAVPPGQFTDWEELPANTDILFYEGLHGAVVTDDVNVARYADLKIGVVPVINLEWTQKLHRDRNSRGYTTEAVTETILRRMHDYVYYICPQFSRDGHQLPARRDRRHLESLRRALHPDARRIHRRHPLSRAARGRFPLSRLDDRRAAGCRGPTPSSFRATSSISRCNSSSPRGSLNS